MFMREAFVVCLELQRGQENYGKKKNEKIYKTVHK